MVSCGFLISLNCLDHFPVVPAIAPISATGHQLITLCRSICAEEKAQILDPLMGSECFTTVPWLSCSSSFHCICCSQN